MRLKTKKIDVLKVNEPARLTTGSTSLNCYAHFYFHGGNIDFRDKITKFKTPGVTLKHSHSLSSIMGIGYIVVKGRHVSLTQQTNTVLNRKDWRN